MKVFKERKLETVSLSPNIVAAFAKVHQRILKECVSTTVYSDDMIQIGPLCGGRNEPESSPDTPEDAEKNTREFFFSVHLSGDASHLWYLALDRDEIQGIAEGKVTALPLWGCQDPTCGFKTFNQDSSCHWCDFDGARGNYQAERITPEEEPLPMFDEEMIKVIVAEEEPDEAAFADRTPEEIEAVMKARAIQKFIEEHERNPPPPSSSINSLTISAWLKSLPLPEEE
jgi:hypothetical protein